MGPYIIVITPYMFSLCVINRFPISKFGPYNNIYQHITKLPQHNFTYLVFTSHTCHAFISQHINVLNKIRLVCSPPFWCSGLQFSLTTYIPRKYFFWLLLFSKTQTFGLSPSIHHLRILESLKPRLWYQLVTSQFLKKTSIKTLSNQIHTLAEACPKTLNNPQV